jgi:hypothetical protein
MPVKTTLGKMLQKTAGGDEDTVQDSIQDKDVCDISAL